ncbi:hypothetical protein E8E13_007772 [Curvularia kusanoi]|uniref:ABC transporter domain-containing protein n=1 Tax=Curvularia kusanoi TaxID=90978 RepID=A0A9P4W8T6_CURKU|nr:hypothetical protein E8E13_007772 [Curvularia kusanoi]
MDLLELTPLRDASVGAPGSGLSIEQRKRLTLATELVAKPTLLFLDEPTSGLDGQLAHEICRFMPEHIFDVVQGRFGTEIDWPQIWLDSPERARVMLGIDELNAGIGRDVDNTDASLNNKASFGTPLWYQTKLVIRRQMIALWRNPDYIWNKIGLHITNGLFGGFTF